MMLPAAIPAPKLLKMRAFARNMRILGIFYLLLSLAIWFYPQILFTVINFGPKYMKLGETLPDPSSKVYMIFGGSYFAVLFALSFLAAESPYTRGYALAHLLGKTVGLVGAGYLYLNEQNVFAYGFICGVEILLASVLIWNLFRIGFAPHLSDLAFKDEPTGTTGISGSPWEPAHEPAQGPDLNIASDPSLSSKDTPPGDSL